MFKVLLKKQLLELRELYFHKKSKKGRRGMRSPGLLILFALMYAGIGVSLGAMMWPLCEAFVQADLSWLYFMMVFFLGLMVGIVGSVFSAYTTLYRAKDNEMLLAMPIRPADLLLARMTGVFLSGFAFVCLACIPAIAVYMSLAGFSLPVLLGSLAGVLALGMTVTALTCLFGWVVALLSNKTRNKSFTTVLFSLLLLGLYYAVYFKISDFIRYMIANAVMISEKISSRAYVLKLIGQGFTGRPAGIVLMLGIGIVLLALTVLLLAKSFHRMLATDRGTKQAVYKAKTARQSTVRGALIRREFRHFTQSPAYLLNCGLGLILMLGGMIYLLIRSAAVREGIENLYAMVRQESSGFDWVITLIRFAPALLVCFLASTCPISAPSVSVEGQNLWILRMLPAREKDLFFSKQALHLILVLPVSVAAVLLLTAFTQGTAVHYIANTLLAVSFVFFDTALGLMLGLKKPNLNWTNETQAVKQGLAVGMTLLGGMAVPLGMGLIVYFLRNVCDVTPYLWIPTALAALLLNRWIFTRGGERWRELG